MPRKDTHKQADLFGSLPAKRVIEPLSPEKKAYILEREEARRAWKWHKSNQKHTYTEREVYLLRVHYGVIIKHSPRSIILSDLPTRQTPD